MSDKKLSRRDFLKGALAGSAAVALGSVSGIAFAYPTNRRWVFKSKNPNIFSEFVSFVGSRAVTWILGWLLNMLMVNVLGVSMQVSTVIVGIVVVIGNYVFAKLLVFRKGQKQSTQS